MKKQIVRITAAFLTLISFTFSACAEQVGWFTQEDYEWIFTFTETGVRLEREPEVGAVGGRYLKKECVEYFSNNRNYIVQIDALFSNPNSYLPNDYISEGVYNLVFHTSDRKSYRAELDTSKGTVYTVNELIQMSGIPDYKEIKAVQTRYGIGWMSEIFIYTEYKNGWQTIGDDRYYVKYNGTLARKSTVINGTRYKFTSDGVCRGKYTGWTKSDSGRRYWKDGKLIKNKWLKTKSGKRYYADEKGYVTLSERTD